MYCKVTNGAIALENFGELLRREFSATVASENPNIGATLSLYPSLVMFIGIEGIGFVS